MGGLHACMYGWVPVHTVMHSNTMHMHHTCSDVCCYLTQHTDRNNRHSEIIAENMFWSNQKELLKIHVHCSLYIVFLFFWGGGGGGKTLQLTGLFDYF